MRPEEIAARVWPDHGIELEPLGGGITNQNFKVAVGGGLFVLRIGGKDTELLGIDRSVEHGASLVAAASGVGPEVVDFIEPDGYLVTRFVEGRPIPPEEMHRPETAARVANVLRLIHEGPPIPGRFDSFRVVEAYARTAEEHGVRVPQAYSWAKERADEIERARGRQPLRPCHNDLLNANFIDDGARIRIVDWEYAGMGDVFFDLANFSINHEFGESENDAFLRAYFGELRAEDSASLRLMRFMSDFREAMWGVVQQGISELEFDFVAYADEHFARLERTAAEPSFREALAAA
ncbi:MAG TPA: phosphotransferase [Gaiellaceae bacterium]|nr:phosphotransferase [Gaiellaceae bacterium]